LFSRARAYARKGDYGRAIADYDRAIELDSRIAEPFLHRAAAYHAKGETDRAVRDSDLAIERLDPKIVRAPGYAPAYAGRGLAHMFKQDYRRAVEDYGQAVRLDRESPSALYGLGLARVKLGDREDGQQDMANAKAMEPEVDEDFRRAGLQ